MNADMGVDDELLAGQANAVIGNLALGESLLRNGQVHHDLGLGLGQVGEVEPIDFELQQPFINMALLALGAGNGDLLAVLDLLGAVAGTDDAGNAQLTGDNGGMTGPAATVGDDGRSNLHDRLPVGIGHVGDQHLALLESCGCRQRRQ